MTDNDTTHTMTKENTVLELNNISKEYLVYPNSRLRLKSLITGNAYHKNHTALQDITFKLNKGECLGLIGSNGAGKSTLLKIITNTLQPSSGKITRNGRITAILELGAGFHPDFTGRENLYFGASLIGISHEKMSELEKEVLDFSGIGEAIDRPVKTYSSGMVVRLAFSLVTSVEPDILIIDEALAVGDQNFQKKCIEKIKSFQKNGCTILFCSHSPYHIRQLCSKALWLKNGKIQALGDVESTLLQYESSIQNDKASNPVGTSEKSNNHQHQKINTITQHNQSDWNAKILSADIKNLEQTITQTSHPRLNDNDLSIEISVRGNNQERPHIGFMIEQVDGVGITSITTQESQTQPKQNEDGTWSITLTFKDLPLHSGQYVISIYLFDTSGLIVYDEWYQFKSFSFIAKTKMPGLVRIPHTWH